MIKAVIFDMDGVVSDTELDRFKLLRELLKEKGCELSEEEYFKSIMGRKSSGQLLKIFGAKLSEDEVDEIINKRREACRKNPEKHIKPVPGILPLCKELTGKYELAIVSSAVRNSMELTIRHLDLEDYFKIVVSADDVEELKPNPEPYLKAANKLELESEECVAIEDTKTGIASAKSAGMACIGKRNKIYESRGHNEDLSEADIVVEELAQILDAIKKLEGLK